MDINNAASSRAAFYDRGADNIIVSYYGTNVAPHGLTTRDTLTVAANTKVIVNGLMLDMTRSVASPADALSTAYFLYTPFGGGADVLAYLRMYNSVMKAREILSISPSFVMYPGDVLECITSDINAGGSISYSMGAVCTIFDY